MWTVVLCLNMMINSFNVVFEKQNNWSDKPTFSRCVLKVPYVTFGKGLLAQKLDMLPIDMFV